MSTNFKLDRMGTIYVTDDLNFVKNVPYDMAKIISLDEGKSLDPNGRNVVVGTCLLPPVEAYIAESDGDEDLYYMHYMTYLNSAGAYEFIGALIAALYMGQNLILYAPQMRENISISKLRQLMWDLYGVGIGVPSTSPCEFDPRCIPIWLNMMYEANIITVNDFLYQYPEGVQLNNNILDKLIHDLIPVCNSYNEAVEEIKRYQKNVQKSPNVRMAIYSLR